MSFSYADVTYRSLAGKTVLITGGASGIGAEMVRAFRAQDAKVYFLDIADEAGHAVAAETAATFLDCNLRDIEALRAAVAAIGELGGGIDILVNNAGRDDRHRSEDVQPAYWHAALADNLDHQFFAVQAAAPFMRQRGGGSIIMMGSISWMRGNPSMPAYTTAKAAINGLTRTLARDLGSAGIRVNCIVPGAILTERQKRLWEGPEVDRQFIEAQALKFRLDTSHVARMALFLGSDESAGCTGANFFVDGGLASTV